VMTCADLLMSGVWLVACDVAGPGTRCRWRRSSTSHASETGAKLEAGRPGATRVLDCVVMHGLGLVFDVRVVMVD
jgi:hypothetical protein